MAKAIKKAGWLETVFLLAGYLERYQIEGDSMTPTLQPGDEVVIDPRGMLNSGDIVVIRHPFKSDVVMVKRIEEIEEDGSLYLLSDNPEGSQDSRTFGAVPIKYLKGKVVAVI
ncbi:MAG: nickel-type superoxide dismutase maturation protease [Pyrinomonadaceae bacterium]|nr:nickel-type superoxide dismutase maturation protease [Pyrinomonadaceae bacterium]